MDIYFQNGRNGAGYNRRCKICATPIHIPCEFSPEHGDKVLEFLTGKTISIYHGKYQWLCGSCFAQEEN